MSVDQPDNIGNPIVAMPADECGVAGDTMCVMPYDGVNLFVWEDGSTTEVPGNLWAFTGVDGSMYTLPIDYAE